MKSFINYTIYFEELIDLNLIMRIVENHLNKPMTIFIDNQIAIQIIRFLKNQFGQYMFKNLTQRIINCENNVQLHWISTHENVSKNEIANIIIKKTTKWKKSSRLKSLISIFNNLKTLISTIKTEFRIWIKNNWI